MRGMCSTKYSGACDAQNRKKILEIFFVCMGLIFTADSHGTRRCWLCVAFNVSGGFSFVFSVDYASGGKKNITLCSAGRHWRGI